MNNDKINWPDVWTEIGEAFENHQKYGFPDIRGREATGICWGLVIVLWPHLQDYYKGQALLNKIVPIKYRSANEKHFWFDCNIKGNYERATFCYFMAAMGDEFEEFLEWCRNNE